MRSIPSWQKSQERAGTLICMPICLHSRNPNAHLWILLQRAWTKKKLLYVLGDQALHLCALCWKACIQLLESQVFVFHFTGVLRVVLWAKAAAGVSTALPLSLKSKERLHLTVCISRSSRWWTACAQVFKFSLTQGDVWTLENMSSFESLSLYTSCCNTVTIVP